MSIVKRSGRWAADGPNAISHEMQASVGSEGSHWMCCGVWFNSILPSYDAPPTPRICKRCAKGTS